MPHSRPDSEHALENATIALFAQLGWQTADCFEETFGLQAALVKLNPDPPRPSRLPSKN